MPTLYSNRIKGLPATISRKWWHGIMITSHAAVMDRVRRNPLTAKPHDLLLVETLRHPKANRFVAKSLSREMESTEVLRVLPVKAQVLRIGVEVLTVSFKSIVTGWHELDIPRSDLAVEPEPGMVLRLKLYLRKGRIVGYDEVHVCRKVPTLESTAQSLLPPRPTSSKDQNALLTYRAKLRRIGVKQEVLDVS